MDCLEPALRLGGIDALRDGLSISYANLISTVMPTFMGTEWFAVFLKLYNRLIRTKEIKDNEALYQHCMLTSKNNDAHEILIPYLMDPDLAYREISKDENMLDLYEPFIGGLVAHLRHMFGISKFEIVLDRNSTKATSEGEMIGFLKYLESLGAEHQVSEICRLYPDVKIQKRDMVDPL